MDIIASLSGFDWIVVIIVGTAAAFGLMRGFIAEVASLAGWFAGFVAVRLFHAPAKAIFVQASGSEMIGAIAAVLGPFLLALLGVKLIGSYLSNAAKGSSIGAFDRILGLGFGLVKGFLGASLIFLLITLALRIVPGGSDRPDWLARARTTPTLALVASAMVGWVGEAWKQPQPLIDPHADVPGFGDDAPADDGGYDRKQRSALDSLLDEQEKKSPSTAI